MKITLDLDALVANGKLTTADAERLKGYAAEDTGALGTNVFLALGAAVVAAGVGVLVPTMETAIAIGVLLTGIGLWLRIARVERWALFGQIVLIIGVLAFVGGVGALFGELIWVRALLTIGLAVAAVGARSGMLAALAVLAFAASIIINPDLDSAQYLTISIVILAALVLGLYILSLRLPHAYERLAIIAMRTAILLVNVAFFLGSLLGDSSLGLSSVFFSIAWALAMAAFAIWAVFANRRWVVNTMAVFGAIHFFTQWFSALGAQPLSILGGGLLLIAFGLGLAWFNRWVGIRKEAQRAAT
ncbi:hypothetical protein [Devosia sp. 2618]|uniref:hypothetical protein n=1 Tax=Devosia sp. 2618 TaxID=3156454 RepID=UPI0033997209